MNLAEVELVFFLPVVFLAYWLGPKKPTWQNGVLLLASWVFYATWSWRLLPLLVASTLIDHAVARWLGDHPLPEGDTPDAALVQKRRRVLALSLLSNLGTLAVFKYAGFFATSLNQLFALAGAPDLLPVLRLALPIGLSFYTMQRIGYVLDVYYGRVEPCRSLLTFSTFVAFFPQLIAGPIGRSHELLPQYDKPRTLDAEMLAKGAGAFLVGYVLKAYVAEQLAPVVAPVFAAPGTMSRLAHWAALVGYGAQVFADFAGYSLIAIGVGRVLGIELPQNFDYPYLSVSLPELWRRWHISLNRWLFDYLFGPMTTGESFMRGRIDLAFIVVFLISGLWHGALWTFVLWGLLHGIGLVVHHRYDEAYKKLCRKDRVWVARRKTVLYRLAGWATTIGFFLLTLVPFRAPSLEAAGRFALGLVRGGAAEAPPMTSHPILGVLLVVAFHLVELPALSRIKAAFFALPGPLRGISYGLVIVFLAMFAPVGEGTFIYAQF